MPLYEYECDACGNRFEKIQKFSDPPADECPKCGAKQLRKLVSSPAIQFKGSGWYITDYAKKGMTTTEGSKSGDDKGTSDKSATKDDKPASSSAPSTSSDSTASSTTTSKP